MTAREKAKRAEIKKELQGKGILPPDKPKLNRKKFAAEVWKEFEEECTGIEDIFELHKCLGWMVSDKMHKVNEEQVGVLKLMKLTVEVKRFKKRLRDEGRISYKFDEIYEIIKPILNL
ncbi:hypothetical protein LY28_02741 [Ruminiclostridium sufflavum DSM 19573]|uniref:Uncharacterized protein n=2 Tax=Ruminiclostridium TaxID=1508657 RepID=A0A318XHP8_9FIRM|nr:hypothetical protein LY28_02741 [Ruminiclostridium sufflavum DSM 19573]